MLCREGVSVVVAALVFAAVVEESTANDKMIRRESKLINRDQSTDHAAGMSGYEVNATGAESMNATSDDYVSRALDTESNRALLNTRTTGTTTVAPLTRCGCVHNKCFYFLKLIMQALDLTKTGKISAVEWAAGAHSHLACAGAIPASCTVAPGLTEQVCKMFHKLDKNADHELEMAEVGCLAVQYAAGNTKCATMCTAIGVAGCTTTETPTPRPTPRPTHAPTHHPTHHSR